MPEQASATQTTSSVTKIVRMGDSTLLLVDLGGDASAPEGEYDLRAITVLPRSDVPSGAGVCIIKIVVECSTRSG